MSKPRDGKFLSDASAKEIMAEPGEKVSTFNAPKGVRLGQGGSDEYTETRTLRKALTKVDIRNVLRQAFPGMNTGYAEAVEGMDVAGVILVGEKHQSLWCKRGQERHMRQTFLELVQEAWRASKDTAE